MQPVEGGLAQRTSGRASKCGVCPRGFGYPGKTGKPGLTRPAPRRNNFPPLSVADQGSDHAVSPCPPTHYHARSPISRLRATIELCAAVAKHSVRQNGIGHVALVPLGRGQGSARLAVQLNHDREVRTTRAREKARQRLSSDSLSKEDSDGASAEIMVSDAPGDCLGQSLSGL
jgi:hypothetical protein